MVAHKVLVDSSFLYVLYNRNDPKHQAAQQVARVSAQVFVIPDVVLTEVAFLFRRAGGVMAVARFLDTLVRTNPQLEPVTAADLERARTVMMQYASANLDFVDCCIIALAERLGITELCNFARPDRSIARLKDGTFLELLP
jgi:predicted nucleic acid-binding protein